METIGYLIVFFAPLMVGSFLAIVVIVLLEMFFGFGDDLFK
jgi:hypothetical protein